MCYTRHMFVEYSLLFLYMSYTRFIVVKHSSNVRQIFVSRFSYSRVIFVALEKSLEIRVSYSSEGIITFVISLKMKRYHYSRNIIKR